MPNFTTEISVDPSEFLDSCSINERNRLIEILIEDGYVLPNEETKRDKDSVNRPNLNDEMFQESLNKLSKCRDLLSTFEENYINNMAAKYKYLR